MNATKKRIKLEISTSNKYENILILTIKYFPLTSPKQTSMTPALRL